MDRSPLCWVQRELTAQSDQEALCFRDRIVGVFCASKLIHDIYSIGVPDIEDVLEQIAEAGEMCTESMELQRRNCVPSARGQIDPSALVARCYQNQCRAFEGGSNCLLACS